MIARFPGGRVPHQGEREEGRTDVNMPPSVAVVCAPRMSWISGETLWGRCCSSSFNVRPRMMSFCTARSDEGVGGGGGVEWIYPCVPFF